MLTLVKLPRFESAPIVLCNLDIWELSPEADPVEVCGLRYQLSSQFSVLFLSPCQPSYAVINSVNNLLGEGKHVTI